MSPGDVRTFKRGTGNSLVVGLGVWAVKKGRWIDIHLTGPDNSHTIVTNNPESVRFHPTLFHDLRQTLVKQKCWEFGEEGADSTPVVYVVQPRSRFHPVRIQGESLSETIIRDRGAF